MRIISGRGPKGQLIRGAVVTVGVFDGMHRGHVRVIRETVRRARKFKVASVVVTFSPHPVHVLRPDEYCPLIVSLEHRLELIAQCGVDICWVIPFRKSFSALGPQEFVKRYLLQRLSPRMVVVGSDFRFGQNRSGDIKSFAVAGKKTGFDFVAISIGAGGQKKFSSTLVRQYIATGNLRSAAAILGRPVSLLGRVVRGEALGRRLGYPTANIHPFNELFPPSGIYLVNVRHKHKLYRGMAYIGRKPSFQRVSPVVVEVHLFNFHRSLYGQKILVEFLKKIRDERAFQSQDELAAQIRKDEQDARSWFSRRNKS